MDFPENLAASNARTDLCPVNWTYDVLPSNYDDLHLFATSGSPFTGLGVPGITLDARTSGQPQYSNNLSGYPYEPVIGPTCSALSAPESPTLFLTERDGTNLGRFVRISLSDIAPDPDGFLRVGLWMRPVRTGENCSNTAYRYFLCSSCFDQGSFPPSGFDYVP